MQRCPKCNRTYQDDSQKFCTFDGGRLMVDAEAPTTLDLGATVRTDVAPELGATVMGPVPDLGKTVAANKPQTSEIPPPAPTGPTNSNAVTWADTSSSTMQPPPASATGGATTASTLGASPGSSPATAASSPVSSASTAGSSSASHAQAGAAQARSAAPSPVSVAAAPRKSGRGLLIAGGLGALLLLLVLGGVGIWLFTMKRTPEPDGSGTSISTEKSQSTTTGANQNSANANSATGARQPPVEAPPNATKFTNSRDKVSGSLAEHYMDFSLYYPNGWTIDQKPGANFFKANRMLSDETGDYLLESAAVSWYQSNGTMQLDRPIFPNRVEYYNNLFSKDYPEYRKTSERETNFNGLDGYEFTFQSLVKGTGKGDINLWGRVIFLPVGNEDARNGIVLLMLASSAAPEIKAATDVGEKGQLPVILKTFRLGPS